MSRVKSEADGVYNSIFYQNNATNKKIRKEYQIQIQHNQLEKLEAAKAA